MAGVPFVIWETSVSGPMKPMLFLLQVSLMSMVCVTLMLLPSGATLKADCCTISGAGNETVPEKTA